MLPETGWQVFPFDPELKAWLDHVRPYAEHAAAAPENTHWLRHGGTWFAGVDALENDTQGRVAGGPILNHAPYTGSDLALHKGQISVTYPGYPVQDPGDSDTAHRFRKIRDAAHMDGLLPEGPDRRRFIREPHAWILGLPLTPMHHGNAPLVVWDGSHRILQSALANALAPHPEHAWGDIDITEAYQTARRHCFDTCRRIEITADPGQAILLHRHLLHGVAPWSGPPEPPRNVIYFRPLHPGGIKAWIKDP